MDWLVPSEVIDVPLHLFSPSGRRCGHTSRTCVCGDAGNTKTNISSLSVGEGRCSGLSVFSSADQAVRCGVRVRAEWGLTRAGILPEKRLPGIKRVGGMLDCGIYPRRSEERG